MSINAFAERSPGRGYSFFALGVVAAIAAAFTVFSPGCAPVAPLPGYTVKIMPGDGHGSGVHIGNGFIVTATHVVGDHKTADLKLDDGTTQTAEVLWVNKEYDIALLRTADTLDAVDIDCSATVIGEEIRATGNPVIFEFLSAWGHVSGIEREFDPDWKNAVPTDVTTVPGMSGGPSVGRDGRLRGINVGVVAARAGIGTSLTGFGIMVPSSTVCSLMGRG